MVAANLLLGQVDVSEAHQFVLCKRRRGPVPRWRLLLSSASAFRRDPPHEERAARVNLFGHLRLEVARSEHRRLGPVVFRVDASACERQKS